MALPYKVYISINLPIYKCLIYMYYVYYFSYINKVHSTDNKNTDKNNRLNNNIQSSYFMSLL